MKAYFQRDFGWDILMILALGLASWAAECFPLGHHVKPSLPLFIHDVSISALVMIPMLSLWRTARNRISRRRN